MEVTCTQIERSAICLCIGEKVVAEKAVRAVSSSGTSSAFLCFRDLLVESNIKVKVKGS